MRGDAQGGDGNMLEVDRKEEVCKHISQLLFPLESAVLCVVLTLGCCVHRNCAIFYNTGFERMHTYNSMLTVAQINIELLQIAWLHRGYFFTVVP